MVNKVTWQTSTRAGDRQVTTSQDPTIDLVEVFLALRRRSILIASILAFALSAAVTYLATTPPRYTASSMLFFDVRKSEPFQQQGYPNAAADSAFVDSQVEVLRSENIARSVVQNLNLLSDPAFAHPEGGLLAVVGGSIQGLFRAILGADKVSTESDQLSRVVRLFQANLTIKRIGLTYVISIDYRSLDPNKAASISNAVAEAYIVGELESRYHAARRANTWLQERVSELKTMAQNTERAVAETAKNNVVDTGALHLNEQQLADLSSQRRVVLKDLETAAKTYRVLHETLLQRVTEFTQQQSFPMTEARVVSSAFPPLEKSDPKALRVLGVASLLGLACSLGAAFAREYFDDGLRSSHQVEKRVGIDCLGILPTVGEGLRRRWWMPKWHQDSEHGHDEMSIIDLHNQRHRHHPHKQAQAASGDRTISTAVGEYRFVADKPFSGFAETIRSLEVAAEAAGSGGSKMIIGVTSALPGEGKSVVAANLSEVMAASGSKTLLIDGDCHHLGLTRRLAPGAKVGLMHALAGQATIEDLTWRGPNINLKFLPMSGPTRATHSVGTVSSAAMQKLLESVQDRYDCVIVDLPPLTPVADVKAMSHLIDYFILVIEAGRTSHQAVIDALKTAPLVLEKLLGAVLNKADPTVLKRLESYKGSYYNAQSSGLQETNLTGPMAGGKRGALPARW